MRQIIFSFSSFPGGVKYHWDLENQHEESTTRCPQYRVAHTLTPEYAIQFSLAKPKACSVTCHMIPSAYFQATRRFYNTSWEVSDPAPTYDDGPCLWQPALVLSLLAGYDWAWPQPYDCHLRLEHFDRTLYARGASVTDPLAQKLCHRSGRQLGDAVAAWRCCRSPAMLPCLARQLQPGEATASPGCQAKH